MSPTIFAMRRPVTSLMLVAALVSGGVLGLSKMQADTPPPLNAPKTHSYLDYIGMRATQVKGYIVGQFESYFPKHKEEHHQERRKIALTSPKAMDVIITQSFVCQIRSLRHIDIRALDSGYLEPIHIREGQVVKKGDLLFKIKPVLYETKRDAEKAEANLANLEYQFTEELVEKQAVSGKQALLYKARRDRAKANADKAQAELDFTDVKAPFDGIVDRQHEQQGSLIKEGDILTTLSDNSVMWVYFNVPERYYYEYMAAQEQHEKEDKIELVQANGDKFPQTGTIGAIEADFDNETGNIKFRADFKNRKGLLRYGQTGTVLISRTLKNALVIPQRAGFENLDKRYVYVVDKDDVVHQREIFVQDVMDDIYVIKKGVGDGDRIVLEGTRQVRDGEKVEYEFRQPELVLAKLKNKAE